MDPNDAWLMRAAGGEDEPDDNLAAAVAPRDDDQFSFEVSLINSTLSALTRMHDS